MDSFVKEWVDFADIDLKVAKHLNDNFVPKPFEIICFHAQQAAEKSIKALYIEKISNKDIPKVHNIHFLLQQLHKVINIDDKYFEYGDILTPYGIEVKYPDELEIEEHHATKAIQMAEEICEWVKNNLS